ncbi:hypothetical protein ACA910_019332 [Epithemia clementina (nom. ined.)]
MKASWSFVAFAFLGLLGMAFAFIRPAQPLQVNQPAEAAFVLPLFGLDNPAIQDDPNILPARKCGFCMG